MDVNSKVSIDLNIITISGLIIAMISFGIGLLYFFFENNTPNFENNFLIKNHPHLVTKEFHQLLQNIAFFISFPSLTLGFILVQWKTKVGLVIIISSLLSLIIVY